MYNLFKSSSFPHQLTLYNDIRPFIYICVKSECYGKEKNQG